MSSRHFVHVGLDRHRAAAAVATTLVFLLTSSGFAVSGPIISGLKPDSAPSATGRASDQIRPYNLLANDEFAPRWKLDDMQSGTSFYMEIEHSSVTLRCDAEGRPTPKVTWLKNNEPFTNRQHAEIIRKRSSIRLPDLISSDKGNYTCVVSNNHGELRHVFTLDVVVRLIREPVIDEGPRNQTVDVGKNVTLLCRYHSDLIVWSQWIKYEFSAPFDNRSDFESTVGIVLNTNAERLVLINVSEADTGIYMCQVTNAIGTVNASSALVVRSTSLPGRKFDHLDVSNVLTIYVFPTAAFFIVVVILLTIAIFARTYITRRQLHLKFRDVKCSLLMQAGDNYSLHGGASNKQWGFDPNSIELGERLGEGAFGEVYKASLCTTIPLIDSTGQKVTVAVKRLKDLATPVECRAFINEIDTMKEIGRHVNVIEFIGCCMLRDRPHVVVEFARYGCLRDFLRHFRPRDVTGQITSPNLDDSDSTQQPYHQLFPDVNDIDIKLTAELLLAFAYQVATGMEFIASKKIIHRDLAARNVLVTGTDDLVVKIADFGLTRHLSTASNYYRHKSPCRVPFKWMSPESLLRNKYTLESDVWSYGVLLWEIYTYGATPYPSIPAESLSQLLERGYRMGRPEAASLQIFETMLRCWSYKPNNRPSFRQLIDSLKPMLQGSTASQASNSPQTSQATSSDCGTASTYLAPASPSRRIDGIVDHKPSVIVGHAQYDSPTNRLSTVLSVHNERPAVSRQQNALSCLTSRPTLSSRHHDDVVRISDVDLDETRRLLLRSSSNSTSGSSES